MYNIGSVDALAGDISSLETIRFMRSSLLQSNTAKSRTPLSTYFVKYPLLLLQGDLVNTNEKR